VEGSKAVAAEEKKVSSVNTPVSQSSKAGLHKMLRIV